RRKPDIPVPYLYVDMGVAVLCASFMSFGVKRRWRSLGTGLTVFQIVPGGSLRVSPVSPSPQCHRAHTVLRGEASGSSCPWGIVPSATSATTLVPVTPVPVSPQAYSLQHSTEDRLAYLDHLLGGELALQLLFLLYGLLALAFLSGYYVRTAAQVLAVLLPLAILLIDGNLGYWHALRRVEFWNQMKLIGQNVGIFGAVVILATDG
ncbi:TM101 protein, partial [Peucedramus taeniatus]|nr:TM101 protein [Peucedramus taeniatus]